MFYYKINLSYLFCRSCVRKYVHSYTILNILTGEYASAIETLVTAISLIKQSKVANDDRCKILISSLQDTLHGVETKSYGSARRGKYFTGRLSYLLGFFPRLKKIFCLLYKKKLVIVRNIIKQVKWLRTIACRSLPLYFSLFYMFLFFTLSNL